MGSPIAFIDGARNLCLSEADGSGLRRLAEARWDERGHNLLGHYWPTWAPDGRRLAFSSLAVEGKSQLSATTYVVESQGGSPVALYRSPAGVPPVIAPNVPHYLYWSPDSQRLALVAPGPEGLTLFIADVATGKTAPVVAGAPLFPAWSPAGSQLLLHPGNQLLMVELADGPRVRGVAGGAVGFRTPAWSPDGSRIAFTDQPEEDKLNLITADPWGRDVRTEVELDGPVAFLWSPTGEAIAFATLSNPQAPLYSGLRLLHLATRRVAALTSQEILAFFWSPDGRRLACVVPDATEGLHSWVVLDLQGLGDLSGGLRAAGKPRARRLASHFPSQDMLTLCAFFDQYARSHQLWSADGSKLVFSGRLNLNGHTRHGLRGQESHILVADVADDRPPTSLGEGSLAFWPKV